jgi:EmrB/QacA subfamily drug resistance transporter
VTTAKSMWPPSSFRREREPAPSVAVTAPRVSSSVALAAVSLTAFFVGLSTSMLSVAVPAIVRHFQAGPLAATFVILAPTVASTALMLSMGRIGDLVGRRKVYLAAIGAFTVASLLAAVAPSVWLLIALEACQAIGIAALWANNAALVLELVPADRASHALGAYYASVSAAQLIGPSIGGAIASAAGWRWIFLLSVPVGIISLLACRAVLPRGTRPKRGLPVDLPGNILVLTGLSGLIISLSLTQTSGWLSPPVIGGAAVAVVLLAAFAVRELKVQHPLLDLRIFADRPLALAMASACANAMAQWSPVLLMVLYFQAVSGDSALQAGLKITPLPVVSVVAAVSAGRLSQRFRTDTLVVVGSGLAFAGIALLAVTIGGGYPAILVALALIGCGSGIFGPANSRTVMSRGPQLSGGILNGTRLMLSEVFYLVSTTVVLAIVTTPLAPGLRRQFYAGTASRLSHAVALQLVTGYKHAILVLAVLALVGTITAVASRTGGQRTYPATRPVRLAEVTD